MAANFLTSRAFDSSLLTFALPPGNVPLPKSTLPESLPPHSYSTFARFLTASNHLHQRRMAWNGHRFHLKAVIRERQDLKNLPEFHHVLYDLDPALPQPGFSLSCFLHNERCRPVALWSLNGSFRPKTCAPEMCTPWSFALFSWLNIDLHYSSAHDAINVSGCVRHPTVQLPHSVLHKIPMHDGTYVPVSMISAVEHLTINYSSMRRILFAIPWRAWGIITWEQPNCIRNTNKRLFVTTEILTGHLITSSQVLLHNKN